MRLVPLALLSLLVALPLRAGSAQDARLAQRTDTRLREALAPVLDSARQAGIPIEPLIDKALEGTSKGAPRGRIVGAVRSLARTLRDARDAVGASAMEAEVVAAADALHAGASTRQIALVRAFRPNEPLTVPLAVLADLVARGVPTDTAASVVIELARDRASDAEFVALRKDVERDIGNGARPAAAVAVRAQGRVRQQPVPTRSAKEAEPGRPPIPRVTP